MFLDIGYQSQYAKVNRNIMTLQVQQRVFCLFGGPHREAMTDYFPFIYFALRQENKTLGFHGSMPWSVTFMIYSKFLIQLIIRFVTSKPSYPT